MAAHLIDESSYIPLTPMKYGVSKVLPETVEEAVSGFSEKISSTLYFP